MTDVHTTKGARAGAWAVLRVVGSLWFAAVLLVLLLIAMACATAFEVVRSTEQALALFYGSWWFEGLLALLAANTLASIIIRWPFSRRLVGFVVTHTSILVLLLGAMVSKHTALNGQIALNEGETARSYVDRYTEILAIIDTQTDTRRQVTLPAGLVHGFEDVANPPLAPLEFGGLRVEAERYVPDSEWARGAHGRLGELQPVTPVRKMRNPALQLKVTTPNGTQTIWLQKNRSRRWSDGQRAYDIAYINKQRPLDFALTLHKFHLGFYPGGRAPRSYESVITLTDPDTGRERNAVVTMNAPVRHGGYELFQSSYNLSGGQRLSVLSIARDPGRPIAYVGYVGLLVGMLIVLSTRLSDHRRRNRPATRQASEPPTAVSMATADVHPFQHAEPELVGVSPGRKLRHPGTWLPALAVLLFALPARAAELPQTPELDIVRMLPVQHHGRIPPLDTLARDMLETATGTQYFRGEDPVRMLLGWTFDPMTWRNEPLIDVSNASLRAALELPADREKFAYTELLGHRPLMDLIQRYENQQLDPSDPLAKKVESLYERLIVLQQAFGGDAIPLIPAADSVITKWSTIPELTDESPAPAPAIRAAWANLRQAFRNNDAAAFASASQELKTALAAVPAAYRPSDARLALEVFNNQFKPFRKAWILLAIGAALALTAVLIGNLSPNRALARGADVLVLLVIATGFGLHTYGLSLRWTLAGRLPAANMYESLLFLSWGAAAFAILAAAVVALVQRGRGVPLTAAVMGALALMLSDLLPLNHYIRPVAPVLLDTIWMSLHVPIIMVSYAVLALAVLLAHVQIIYTAFGPARKNVIAKIDWLHYLYAFVGSWMLIAGIITGSMWGASSWGRYWGWDPKEVWSLVAFLGYMAILHVRVDHERVPRWAYVVAALLGIGVFALIIPKFAPLSAMELLAFGAAAVAGVAFVAGRSTFATACKSIIAFWLIIFTYVGVNYVLGVGLHSYGFGTGPVVLWMYRIGGADLAIVLLCSTAYLLRSQARRAAAVQPQPA